MTAVRRSLCASVWFALFAPVAASAADREFWKHAGGSFVKVDADKWVERDATGKATFEFHERRRTKDFVGLRDQNRKLIIRLRNNACYIHYGLEDPADETKWEKLYEGSWADK